mmetsp:Transcript_8079/g.4277  ORF Transcript_8079/g.4277 Transcript_8079/m.4277 type:complete len:552 (+) Transcript_8079:418-2073(+)|eukprot:CAMPEP_0201283588 /NCGR_PEP_ID=MMETSP1317-20130820/26402_1 /ASSEMBLY_ACC=CAM_ASM_000770 /TAXON_ID=187299 /ORGANISM="Undescribed Undescribed, Strain Undescribed" /LENGTH=551 /DNA_ID=CAMNT_0047600409 /DNA_START=428 /DNA_END=2086 /DNA_ORIENTATION=-
MTTSVSENNRTKRGLDEEARHMVVETVRQLKKKLLTKEKIFEFDKKEIFPKQTIEKLLSDEIGLQLIFIPEEYGGMGGGAIDCCEVTSEMAKICLGVATAFFAIQLGTDPLLVGGTKEQKEKWVGKIAEGKVLVAYGVTEPEAGSNVTSIKTKAEPVVDDDGKKTGYIINGTKQFISTGGYADFVTVLANTPEGLTFFIVEKGTEGFAAGKTEEKHGIRASNTSSLTFTDVFVPAENLIGGVAGQGLKQSNKVFGHTRLMVAAMAYGAGTAAIEIAVNYAKERVQFGTLLAQKQGYTHKLIIPHIVRLEAAKAYIDEIALRLDLSDEDLQVEGSIAKYFTTEVANKTADDAIQALGGYGYIKEFEVEKIKRDVKITCIYEGTSEIQQNIISTFRWKKTWKTKGRFYKNIADEMKKLDYAGSKFYGLCADALNKMISIVHINRLTKKQYIMFALADMMTYVEVGASLLRKAVSFSKKGDIEAEKLEAISKIFANETAQMVSTNILKIITGTGAFDEKTVSDIMKSISYNKLVGSYKGILNDMDMTANIVFER